MNAWNGLIKKEFRLGRTAFLIDFLGKALIYLAAYLYSLKINQPLVLLSISMLIVIPHIFYLLGYMFYSLNAESKNLHLWLHNPQPGSRLLLSKLLTGVSAFVASLFLNSLILWYSLLQSFNFNEIILNKVIKLGFFIITNIFGASIFLAMWFIFIWAVFVVLKKQIGRLSWLAGLGLVIIPTLIMDKFEQTKIYELLTNWGKIKFSFFDININYYFPENVEISAPNVAIGVYVFYAVITIGLFFLSSWLIDRKVEV